MSWSEEAYRSVTSILEDIKAHPFIRELALGTLPKDKFSRYIAQDKMTPEAAAKKWVDANPDKVKAWL